MSDVFIDSRDGNIYKTVEIGNQIWLAENLRYKGVKHRAPNNDENNIPEYGCLYEWKDAIKACPEGWHLPSKKEFKALLSYVEDNKTADSAFLALIANSAAWRNTPNQGTDEFDFGVLPAGYYFYGGNYRNFGTLINFWSSLANDDIFAYSLDMGFGKANVSVNVKESAISVRLIRNKEATVKGKQKTMKNIQYTVDIEYGDADYTTTEVFVLSETDRNFLETALKDLEDDYYIFTTGEPDFYEFEWTAEDIRHLLRGDCYDGFKVETQKTSHTSGDIKGRGFIHEQLREFCWDEYENGKFDDNLEGLFRKSSFFDVEEE